MAEERILIVEDEGIVAADLESVLTKLGYKVVGTVPTGEEAVKKAEETLPNLVLMDIRLKGEMDGIDAAEIITSRFDIPVSYLTAYADERTLDRAKTTMPYGYILKPFHDRDLHATIQMALYKHKMESMITAIGSWHAATLRGIPEAVVATDPKGCVTFMNTMAESLAGWKLKDAFGKKIEDVLSVSEGESSRISLPIQQALKGVAAPHSEDPLMLSTKDGHKIRVQYRVAPGKNEEGDVTGAIVILREHTGRPV